MAQSALKPVKDPDQPLSLVERIDAEFPVGARLSSETTEPTVSSMAERFAPDPSRTRAPETGVPETRAPETRVPETRVSEPQEEPLETQPVFPDNAPDPRVASTPSRGVIAVLSGVALAPAVALGALLWFGTLESPTANFGIGTDESVPVAGGADESAATPSSGVTQAAIAPPAPVAPAKAEISLTAPEEILAEAGETVGFTIDIRGADALGPRSFVSIRDVPEGVSFSSGRPFGDSEWNLAPQEIPGLTMQLPKEQKGAADMRVELVAADGEVLARTTTRLDVASRPTTGLVVRSGEEDRIAGLMEYGQKMMDVGYLAGARAYYQRAAEAGSARALIAVGATYDPNVLEALTIQGARPDAKAAETWYARAEGLGITDRQAEIAAFKKAWIEGAEAATEIHTPTNAIPAAPQNRRTAQAEDGPLSRLVAAASELTASTEWVEVSSPVNVRSGPSSNDEPYKVAAQGTKLRVLGRDGNWVQVSDPLTQQQGWIYRRFLRASSAP